MEHHQVWHKLRLPPFPALKQNRYCDVCVIGAGITGLSVAYELLKNGKKVIVLDKGSRISGESALSTGHVTYAIDDGLSHLENLIGIDKTRDAVDSHRFALTHIEDIIKSEHINCEFKKVPGFLMESKQGKEYLDKELRTIRKLDIPAKMDFIYDRIAIKFNSQAEINPLKYVVGLQKKILEMGGAIYGDALVIETEKLENDEINVITEKEWVVNCKDVVFATNSPTHHTVVVHTKEAAYRSYVIGIKIKKNSFKPMLLWDTENPYHYVRSHPQDDHDVLIVGGEDHRVGQDPNDHDHYEALEAWAKKTLDIEGEVIYKWSGQIIETVDGLAYIGKTPNENHIYEASGDSGHGLTHGAIAGVLISDLILGRDNPWKEIYDPGRVSIKGVGTYIKENIQGAIQNIDWIKPPDLRSPEDLKKDEGAVIQEGLEKVACYKDKEGKVHKCSAVCPHLGALVGWNNTEKTWDCPFHGSRFTPEGEVINGPAHTSLKKPKS